MLIKLKQRKNKNYLRQKINYNKSLVVPVTSVKFKLEFLHA